MHASTQDSRITVATEPDLSALAALIAHPALRDEFDQWQERIRAVWDDPFHPHELTWLAHEAGAPAGFALAYEIPSEPAPFSMIRIGVAPERRRHGLGSALLAAATRALQARRPGIELSLNAWLPSPAAEGFAAHHGYRPVRCFWLMERPRGAAVPVALPDGITLATFDGSETALAGWNDAYNASFARHYHYVRTRLEDLRVLAARPGYRRDGTALAYRDGACVGFCRNELFLERGEIGVLGTVPEARGLGLGRALLRWGVAWLEAQSAPRVTLLVDGENEGALALYRSEGFGVVRTRQVWARH